MDDPTKAELYRLFGEDPTKIKPWDPNQPGRKFYLNRPSRTEPLTASLTIGDNATVAEAQNRHKELVANVQETNRLLKELAQGGPFGPNAKSLLAATREAVRKSRDLKIASHGIAQQFLWQGAPVSKEVFLQRFAHDKYAELSHYLATYEKATTGDTKAITEASVLDKLDWYLLDPGHPVGKEKARWFKEALGFTRRNLPELAKQIVFDKTAAVPIETTAHGTILNQAITIVGANGRRIDVVFGWIRRKEDNIIRLVTAFPTKRP